LHFVILELPETGRRPVAADANSSFVSSYLRRKAVGTRRRV